MKFTNVLKTPIMLKLESGWASISPGDDIDIPERIGDRENGLVVKEESVKKEPIKKEPEKEESEKEEKPIQKNPDRLLEPELRKLTKDGLNDYAVSIGLEKEVNCSMKKSEMIKGILKYQK